MSSPRLSLSPQLIEPRLQRALEAVDALAPAAIDPGFAGRALDDGVVELDDQTRFVPLTLAQPLPASLMAAAIAIGFLAFVGTAGGLLALDLGLDPVVVLGLGLLAGAGVGQLGWSLLKHNFGGRGRSTTTHTGLLLRPELMLVRRPRSVDLIPRESIATIEEQMWEQPPRSRSDPPHTGYAAVLVFGPEHGIEAWRLLELVVEGEVGLTLRAAHAEGRFVSELVKYLVRSWLRDEGDPRPPLPRTRRARSR